MVMFPRAKVLIVDKKYLGRSDALKDVQGEADVSVSSVHLEQLSNISFRQEGDF